MRKPVRSVVANRKYFQGGGLTKNTNPMAVSQPSGIMASSQPLVDMVANSANNPQGGMSPLNYADGGLAKFEPGGMFADRPRVQGLMNTLGNVTQLMQPSRLLAKISEKIPATGIGQYITAKKGDPILDEKVGAIDAIKMYDLIDVIGDRTGQRELVDRIGKSIIAQNPQITPKDLETEIMQKLETPSEQLEGELLLQETQQSKNKLQPFLREGSGKIEKPDGKITKVDDFSEGDGIKQLKKEEKLESDKIPEEDLKKIEEKSGALAQGLEKKEITRPTEKIVKDIVDNNEEVKEEEAEVINKEAEVINQNTAEDQETSEDRLANLMKRFTDAAPKYEGLDSGLAIMQMGAIMAGGTSPNAIKNIADALTVTSEKLIKDKSKRDEFNRQLNLSALQYGLGEVSKEDAQKRQDDRNFITLVASKDGTNPLTGEKISKGENIRVSMTDMLSKDIPSMFKDKDMYVAELDAAAKSKKAITDLINERRKENILSDTAAVKQQELYNKASKQYIQSTAGLKFVDNALITLSEDEVTGLKGGANDLTLKVATALGIKVGHKFKSKKEFEDSVKKAFQKLIPTALGGVQSANSISDRDVQFLADAYIESSILKGGTFNLVTVNEDILMGKLQTLRDTFVENQEAGLSGMRQVNDFLQGRTRPGGGSAETYISEGQRRIKEFREKEIPTVGEIKLDYNKETDVYTIPGLK